jgi:hypothetical protein
MMAQRGYPETVILRRLENAGPGLGDDRLSINGQANSFHGAPLEKELFQVGGIQVEPQLIFGANRDEGNLSASFSPPEPSEFITNLGKT